MSTDTVALPLPAVELVLAALDKLDALPFNATPEQRGQAVARAIGAGWRLRLHVRDEMAAQAEAATA